MAIDTESLDREFRQRQVLANDAAKYRGVFDTLRDQYADCIITIEDASAYLDHKDEVASALKALHSKSVEETRTLYEDILTGLLKDIFPDDPENERVHLDLSVKRGQAALNVEVSNRKGFRRNVQLDKGASVRSILSIGLRFIALSRSNRRRLVVLDEADKEINPIYLPRFAKMVAQLASKIGMQVIYVSHKDHKSFEGYARIIRLSRKETGVTADIISDDASTEIEGWEGEKNIGTLMEGSGLTDIRLLDVKQHANTFIELSPLVNVISGANDVGKSTVLQAIDCVSRNKGREGLIRDEKDKLRIELGIEGGQRIVYQHKRRGSKKTKYQFFDYRNEKTLESHDGTSCPEWVHSYLGMELHRGFDLHIGLDNANSFMFEAGFSEHKRAEILSLNRISGDSQAMIEEHNRRVESHKKDMRTAQKTSAKLKLRLRELGMVTAVEESLEELEVLEQEVRESISREKRLNDLIAQWEKTEKKLAVLSKAENLEPLPEGTLDNVDRIIRAEKIINQWEKVEAKLGILKKGLAELPAQVEPPVLDDRLTRMNQTGKQWSKIEKKLAILKDGMQKLAENPIEEVVIEPSGVQETLEKVEKMLEQQRSLHRRRTQVMTSKAEIERKMKSMVGESCVTCGQPIEEEHIHV